jgi:hypothetical protein
MVKTGGRLPSDTCLWYGEGLGMGPRLRYSGQGVDAGVCVTRGCPLWGWTGRTGDVPREEDGMSGDTDAVVKLGHAIRVEDDGREDESSL